MEGTGFFARCLQHETDHLDGYLYLDRLIGKNARAARKAVKANGWGVPGTDLAARDAIPTRSATDARGPASDARTRRLAGADTAVTQSAHHARRSVYRPADRVKAC